MQLHQDIEYGSFTIRTYGPGEIRVFMPLAGKKPEEEVITQSAVILPQAIRQDLLPARFSELSQEHMAALAGLDVEIVIIGTGKRLHFPPPQVLAPLMDKGIGFEVMDTGAACRTYNILMNERRKVAAALFMIEN